MTRLKFALRSLAIAERKNEDLRKSNEAIHEAAEFEARVAKKLACDEYKTPLGMTPVEAAVWERQKDGTLLMNAKASRLKCARINAEMEMGG